VGSIYLWLFFNSLIIKLKTIKPKVLVASSHNLCSKFSGYSWESNLTHGFSTTSLHAGTNYCFIYQGQTSDAPSKSTTVLQGLRPPHFVQIFANVYFPLSFLFLGLLNDLHINTVSLQWGYSKDAANYIDDYGKYETILFGLIQQLNHSSKSHLHFRINEQFAQQNQL
jgi:hypothetical protein